MRLTYPLQGNVIALAWALGRKIKICRACRKRTNTCQLRKIERLLQGQNDAKEKHCFIADDCFDRHGCTVPWRCRVSRGVFAEKNASTYPGVVMNGFTEFYQRVCKRVCHNMQSSFL